ncbi:MAG: M20/M25/M40 family metallo-hydrolase [Chlamydiia bacterium]|jgi:acetylornithine deacetylase/succinyl-diaminopimelate desuccinylase-like protein
MERALRYLTELVEIPTVSGKPEHHQDLKKGAEAVEKILQEIGFSHTERWTTKTNVDAIFAEHKGKNATKTLLFYGHYDVQPVEPLEEWSTPPFQLTKVGDWYHGRGAEDNKGQLSCIFSALYKNLPDHLNIKFLIEGEEESSSRGLYALIDEKKEALKADYLLVFDVDMISINKGAVTCGTRGVFAFDIKVQTGDSDMHSGLYGGVARSATSELNFLLSKMLGPEGEILVPGFYDTMITKPKEDKEMFHYHEPTGTFARYATDRVSAKERNYFLPTLEINGMFGGHLGSGSKTIIPVKATAKMSIRTVDGLDGFDLIDKIDRYLQSIKHENVEVVVHKYSGGTYSYTDPKEPFIEHLRKAYKKITTEPCETVLSGASIPVASHLQTASGAVLAFAGVGLKEDFIHSPKERFSAKQLEKGVIFIRELIDLFAE